MKSSNQLPPEHYVLMHSHRGETQSRPIFGDITHAAWIDTHTGLNMGKVFISVKNQKVSMYLVLSERPGWDYLVWYRESNDTLFCTCLDGRQKGDCSHIQHVLEVQLIPYSIYVLVDPRDNMVRYVGMSHNPSQRYISHLYDQGNNKANWIAELRRVGLKPVLRTLEEGIKIEATARDREYHWINLYRQAGIPLTNMFPKP